MKDIIDIQTKVITKEQLQKLREEVQKDKYHDRYFLSSNPKEDRIGSYYILYEYPNEKEEKKRRLYIKDTPKDLVVYRLKYYDILRDDAGDTKKAMQLYVLQKTLQFVYKKELEHKEGAEAIEKLLDKVKKARDYFSLKTFLSDNKSPKRKIGSKNKNK